MGTTRVTVHKRGKGRRHNQPDSIITKKLVFRTRETCQGDTETLSMEQSQKRLTGVWSGAFSFLNIYLLGCSSLSCSMQNLYLWYANSQLQLVGSSFLMRYRTWAPALGMQSLSHWAAREVPQLLFDKAIIVTH